MQIRLEYNQVISNLLSNAIKFTDKGGPISISVKIRELTEAENKKKDVIVSIRDTGVGISSEIIDRLFSKFATKILYWYGTWIVYF